MFNGKLCFLVAVFLSVSRVTVNAETHEFHWKTGIVKYNLDGVKERNVISCNGEFPWPDVRVKRGDRVIVHLENGFNKFNTSLHFHGLFQNGTNQMDGPEMITQCPIGPGDKFVYNFTVEHNKGSFWYHSHSRGQYMDGMKGLFIIEDDEFPYKYDEEMVLQLSEWYHKPTKELIPKFLSLYNPTGAEPIPQNLILNNTRNLKWEVKPDTTYLLRLINTGGFVSQYFWIEDHDFTVVEVDGVWVKEEATKMLYITTAQRYSVLLHTKNDTARNYAIMTGIDTSMLDLIPDDLELNMTNYLVYNKENPVPKSNIVDKFDFLDDINLQPVDEHKMEALKDPDVSIVVSVDMRNLGNGVNYAFFNNITHVPPKVPILATVLSSGENAVDARVYGSNTHSYVYNENDIVEIVVNNYDTGTHPFHLHGHVFQVVSRGPIASDDSDKLDAMDPIVYDPTKDDKPNEYPLTRDTVYVNGKSWVVLRFRADNPGVWLFHCHIQWHVMQGLSMVLIEAPLQVQKTNSQFLTDSSKNVCLNNRVSIQGNAAGNKDNFLDLTGEPVQHKELPPGFTSKGIIGLLFSILVAITGLVTIAFYGIMEFKEPDDSDTKAYSQENDDPDSNEAQALVSSTTA